MATDLLGIGTSGVLAHQQLLRTTSNNIVNVNSEGFVRERTLVFTNTIGFGTGELKTERVISDYLQGEVRLDTSAFYAAKTHHEQLSQIDKLLADNGNSVGTALNNAFKAIHSANDAPADLGGRKIVMSELANTVDRFHSLANQLEKQTRAVDSQLEEELQQVNQVITNVHNLNQAVLRTQGQQDQHLMLLDQRDDAIAQLASKIDVRTVAQANGTTLVNLSSGHSLNLDGRAASLSIPKGQTRSADGSLELHLGSNQSRIQYQQFGGTLGGLFKAHFDLEPTKRQLGQLAVAMADGMNQQNRRGMNLDNELGGDIFTLPTSTAISAPNNTGNGQIQVSFIAGKGHEVTPFDYEIRFQSSQQYALFAVDKNGDRTAITSGSISAPGQIEVPGHGISLTLRGLPASGDRFIAQPTSQAASGVALTIKRPEELALASPLRAQRQSANLGSANIAITGVSQTGANSALLGQGLAANAPQKVTIDQEGNYQVYGADGTTLLGIAPAASKGQNLLASLVTSLPAGAVVFSDPKGQVGYEINITGQVRANDSFEIVYNRNGFADNRNGLALADLQNQLQVRKSTSANGINDKMTFHEAYRNLVTDVGTQTHRAKMLLQANEAKLQQSRAVYDGISGVNLEEEAGNLIRFQQSYAASAQIVSTAKTIFETLLASVR